MNYIGSKLSLLDFIDETITEVLEDHNEDLDEIIFADLFAGTGVVGERFKKKNFKIISNDIQYYSYILNKKLISINKECEFNGLKDEVLSLKDSKSPEESLEIVLKYLEELDYVEGFIYENYSPSGTEGKEFQRQYFTDHNAKKCDAIRLKIREWKEADRIDEDEFYILLSSLIYSMDQYANTASVYGAFLKNIKKSAQRELVLREYGSIYNNNRDNQVYKEDINSLIKKIKGDVLYLDPPYNHRQYNTNYHLLETISKYDNPSIRGKTGLRNEEGKTSDFCSKVRARSALEYLIENADFKYIFLSYNNEGIIPIEDIEDIFRSKGSYKLYSKEYRRFKANNRRQKDNKTEEYIHCCIVDRD